MNFLNYFVQPTPHVPEGKSTKNVATTVARSAERLLSSTSAQTPDVSTAVSVLTEPTGMEHNVSHLTCALVTEVQTRNHTLLANHTRRTVRNGERLSSK